MPEMSRSDSFKRKRPETVPPGQVDAERAILNLIKSKKDLGIWTGAIKREIKLPDHVFNKATKSLLSNNLIKEVVNIQNKAKKHYIASEFEPSKELSGGDWYLDGKLNGELIDVLKKVCFGCICQQRVATLEGVHNVVKANGVSIHQVGEILNLMVLDNDIIEVESTGLGDYYSIPLGKTCYRAAGGAGVARASRMSAFATIPCGACPQIGLCTSDGVISPSTCAYYTKWLGIDF